MKNYWIIIFVIISICFETLEAQELIISKDIDISSTDAYDILGKYNNDLLFFHTDNNQYYIDVFDQELAYRDTWELIWYMDRPNVLGVSIADGVNITYNYRNRGERIIRLDKYNIHGEMLDSVVIDHQINTLKDFKYQNSINNQFGCVFTVSAYNTLNIWVIDAISMKLLWYREVFIDTQFKKNFRSLLVSDQGDVIVFKKGRTNFFSREPNFYELLVLSKDKTNQSQLLIENFNFSKYEISFYPDQTNKLFIAGFYYSNDISKTEGLIRIENDLWSFKKVEYFDIIPFDIEITKAYFSNSNQGFIRDLEIKNFIPRKDNGYIVIGEIEKEVLRRSNSVRFTREFNGHQWIDYYHKDILIAAYHSDNTLHWSKILHKNQYSQDDQYIYASFFLFKNQNSLRFIYNDDIKYNTTVTNYTLNPLGIAKRSTMLNTNKKDVRFRIADATQIGFDELLIPSQIHNTLNIIKIKF